MVICVNDSPRQLSDNSLPSTIGRNILITHYHQKYLLKTKTKTRGNQRPRPPLSLDRCEQPLGRRLRRAAVVEKAAGAEAILRWSVETEESSFTACLGGTRTCLPTASRVTHLGLGCGAQGVHGSRSAVSAIVTLPSGPPGRTLAGRSSSNEKKRSAVARSPRGRDAPLENPRVDAISW